MGDPSDEQVGSEGIARCSVSYSESEPVTSETVQSVSDPIDGDKKETESSLLHKQADVAKVLQVLERDSMAIADSFTSLFASLRVALSEATNSSVDHMQCFSDAVGQLQESVLDGASRGNRYINSCIRLNEEMKGMDSLALQLKFLRKNVDALDASVSRLLHLP